MTCAYPVTFQRPLPRKRIVSSRRSSQPQPLRRPQGFPVVRVAGSPALSLSGLHPNTLEPIAVSRYITNRLLPAGMSRAPVLDHRALDGKAPLMASTPWAGPSYWSRI